MSLVLSGTALNNRAALTWLQFLGVETTGLCAALEVSGSRLGEPGTSAIADHVALELPWCTPEVL